MTISKIPSNSLLNLPEEVVRIIFGHLDDKTLYCSVRPVCHQLKTLIDNYLELGLQFLVVSGGGDDGEPELPLEKVSVFLRKKQISSLIVAFKPDDICPVKGYESFGTSCNGRYVIGVEQNVYEYKSTEIEPKIWSKLPSTKVD